MIVSRPGVPAQPGVRAEPAQAGRMADDRGVDRREDPGIEQHAARLAEHRAQQVREVLELLDVLVGIEQLRAEDPDRQVEHEHRHHAEHEVVELHAPVLGPAPALGVEKVRIHQVHQRAADRADHRERHVRRVVGAVPAWHLHPEETARDLGRIETDPDAPNRRTRSTAPPGRRRRPARAP